MSPAADSLGDRVRYVTQGQRRLALIRVRESALIAGDKVRAWAVTAVLAKAIPAPPPPVMPALRGRRVARIVGVAS